MSSMASRGEMNATVEAAVNEKQWTGAGSNRRHMDFQSQLHWLLWGCLGSSLPQYLVACSHRLDRPQAGQRVDFGGREDSAVESQVVEVARQGLAQGGVVPDVLVSRAFRGDRTIGRCGFRVGDFDAVDVPRRRFVVCLPLVGEGQMDPLVGGKCVVAAPHPCRAAEVLPEHWPTGVEIEGHRPQIEQMHVADGVEAEPEGDGEGIHLVNRGDVGDDDPRASAADCAVEMEGSADGSVADGGAGEG